MKKQMIGAALLLLATTGCQKKADEATAPAAQTERAEQEVQQPTPAVSPVSTEILAREPVTEHAEVRHVLISWDAQGPTYAMRGGQDPRGAARTEAEANELAARIVERIQGGEDITVLMREFSEDGGSAATGRSYTATPQAGLVEPFKALSLRLNVGEVGVVDTVFGYHVIQRVE